ncbi:MAG: hypothetical protein EXR77_02905 [Myxococcales bacterium]|nr:hypothetical protein [Myxococcales bacterium]
MPKLPRVTTLRVVMVAPWLMLVQNCADSATPATNDDANASDGAAAAFDSALGDAVKPKAVQPWHPNDQVPNACQSLAAEWDCMLPWPSDWYRQGAQQGKPQLVMPSVPAPKRNPDAAPDKTVDFYAMFPQDGHGILGQIAVKLPNGVDAKALVPAYVGDKINPDFSPSQSAKNLTLVVDADSLQAVAHFAEPDGQPASVGDRFLMLRPVERLHEGHRYIVALQTGLLGADGSAVGAPATFKALRDKTPSAAADTLRPHFEGDVFPVLEKFGVKRGNLLLAWDFTTRSAANATDDMLAVREQLMQTLATLPLEATITKTIIDPKPLIARQFEGHIKVPLYVENEKSGARLTRDATGKVKQNGFAYLDFTLLVPPKLWATPPKQPVRIIQYGHGFFGGREEMVVGVLPHLLDKMGAVGMGIDWWGMALADSGQLVADLIQQPSAGLRFVERAHQGMANQLALTWAAKKGLWSLPQLQPTGQPLTAGNEVYFYGLSQGHILGGVAVALNPWIDRAVLGVGGAGFGLMMSRAAPFGTFTALLHNATGSEQGAARVGLLLTAPMERIDPGTYGPHLRANTYAGGPAKRSILLQCGLADTQVPNLATHLHARILGVPVLQPAPRTVWGLANTAVAAESALVEFDFNSPPLDTTGPAATKGNPVHEAQRYLAASLEQIHRFLQPNGLVEATCSGVCDPE